MFAGKARSLIGTSLGSGLALIIRLGWIGLSGKNTLAFYNFK
jgi:hypothetical protein